MRVRLVVMLGLAMSAVATTANAQTYYSCLKPWAIPDKWIDRHDDPNDGVWTADDTFETVDADGNPLSDADVYADIYTNIPNGTGFQLPRDLGLLVTLKIADPQDGMKSGYFYAVNLGAAGEGANAYRSAIATCQEVPPPHFGDILQPLSGNLKGPTVQGVADLMKLDPGAEWDPATKTVIHSCAPSPTCGSVSPRIVTVLAFDPIWVRAKLVASGPASTSGDQHRKRLHRRHRWREGHWLCHDATLVEQPATVKVLRSIGQRSFIRVGTGRRGRTVSMLFFAGFPEVVDAATRLPVDGHARRLAESAWTRTLW